MIDKLKLSISTLIEHKIDAIVDLMDNHICKLTTFLGVIGTTCHLCWPHYKEIVDSVIAAILVAMRS